VTEPILHAQPIPQRMRGGWIRNGIAVDGGPEAEDTLVWWLQAPSMHCDLRVPYVGEDGVMSFAGTTTYAGTADAPTLTWHPEVELNPSIFEDIGQITWDGADMIETGVYYDDDREIGYIERWQRLPGSDGEFLALSCVGGRLVRSGSYALTLLDRRPAGGTFAAVAWTLVEDAWVLDHCWPPGALAPPPPLLLPDPGLPSDAATVRLDDDTIWTIEER
jgi:hypothetical protein